MGQTYELQPLTQPEAGSDGDRRQDAPAGHVQHLRSPKTEFVAPTRKQRRQTKKTAAARHLFSADEKTFVGARLAREIAKRRRWLRTTIGRGERHDPDASVTDEPLRVDFDPFE
jgi:hypothetical protein